MEEEKTTISPEKEKSIKGRFSGVRKSRWIRFSIACIIYIAFAIWLDNCYILPGLLVLLDIYVPDLYLGHFGRSRKIRLLVKRWSGSMPFCMLWLLFI